MRQYKARRTLEKFILGKRIELDKLYDAVMSSIPDRHQNRDINTDLLVRTVNNGLLDRLGISQTAHMLVKLSDHGQPRVTKRYGATQNPHAEAETIAKALISKGALNNIHSFGNVVVDIFLEQLVRSRSLTSTFVFNSYCARFEDLNGTSHGFASLFGMLAANSERTSSLHKMKALCTPARIDNLAVQGDLEKALIEAAESGGHFPDGVVWHMFKAGAIDHLVERGTLEDTINSMAEMSERFQYDLYAKVFESFLPPLNAGFSVQVSEAVTGYFLEPKSDGTGKLVGLSIGTKVFFGEDPVGQAREYFSIDPEKMATPELFPRVANTPDMDRVFASELTQILQRTRQTSLSR
jgi:hypothetical protein